MSRSRYKVPGVHWEEIVPRERAPLLTGVPVFLGLIPREDLPQGAGLDLEPLADSQGLWQVRDREDSPLKTVGAFGSWLEFEKAFEILRPLGFLGYSVRGFFRNGGGLCHVCILCFDYGVPLDTAVERGLESTEELEPADLLCMPDLMWLYQQDGLLTSQDVVRLQRTALEHCQALGWRFAILDSLPGVDAQGVRRQRGGLKDYSSGALYYPWVELPDGPEASEGMVPPSGHVAGVFARTDRDAGVHKAPANEVLEEAVGLEHQVTDSQQKGLNPVGVNCVRAFPGRGIRIWGARTLSVDPDLVYINVRRLISTVGRWVEQNMASAVFEPNNPRLWTRINRELTSYLTGLFLKGALSGTTLDDAFYVKCDEETNPPEVRDLGQVVTEIGLAVTVPGEFVVVRINQTGGMATISLEVGRPSVPPEGSPAYRIAETGSWACTGVVSITHVAFNPPGRDISGEHVLIQNQSRVAVDMTGWTLQDQAYHTYVFPGFTLAPGASVRVWTREGEDTATDLYWGRRAPVWNNLGDKAFLRDSQGRLVTEYTVT